MFAPVIHIRKRMSRNRWSECRVVADLAQCRYLPFSLIYRNECLDIGPTVNRVFSFFRKKYNCKSFPLFDIRKRMSQNRCNESRVVSTFYQYLCLIMCLVYTNECPEIGALRVELCRSFINVNICQCFRYTKTNVPK